MEKDKISVIVPVYKVEKWLEECVNSICNQTYRNIEILLVDDGSPDNCPDICDEFATRDERIKVIHKENGGVSSARNVGIEVATGKYITFIDSDDYVDINYLAKLYNNLNGCSISECGTVCFDEKGMRPVKAGDPIILDWEDYLTETNLNGFLSYAVVYAKLYERSLFKKIRFPLGCLNGEDEATTFKVVYEGKKVSRIYEALYYYRQREEGASQNVVTDKRIYDVNAFCDDKILFFKEKKRYDLMNFFLAKKAIAFIELIKKSNEEEQKRYCYRIVKEIFYEIWNKKRVPFKYKIYIGFFLIISKV